METDITQLWSGRGYDSDNECIGGFSDGYPPGHYHVEHLRIFEKIVNLLIPRHDIVEIGCHLGRSTTALAKSAKNFGKIVYCIDPFYSGEEPPSDDILAYHFVNNIIRVGLYDHIRILPMRSALAAKLPLCHKISVLHLDGSHLYENVRFEIMEFGDRVEGIIIFHDTDRPDVEKATRSLASNFDLVYAGSEERNTRRMEIYSNVELTGI